MNRLAWAVALIALSWNVLAQTPVAQLDVRADELLSGDADGKLQELGARAAAEGLTVQVTAPSYWLELVDEQILAGLGEGATIAHRETFVESVIVRLYATDDAPAAARSEAPASTATTAASSSRRSASAPESPSIDDERPRPEGGFREPERNAMADAEPMRPAAPALVTPKPVMPTLAMAGMDDERSATAEPAGAGDDASTGAEDPAEAAGGDAEDRMVATAPHAAVPTESEPLVEAGVGAEASPETRTTGDTEAGSEADEPTAIPTDDATNALADRRSLERRLNDGRSIDKTLSAQQLRRGDRLFRTGDWIAVVRASRVGRNFYWLEGDVDLAGDDAIRELSGGKYEVLRRPRVIAATQDDEGPDEPQAIVEADLDERTEMEARYNGGDPVESVLPISRLRRDDVLYVGESLVMVLRRDRVSLKRYWLDGEIDLAREEIEQQGSSKYRVRRPIR